MAFNLEVVPAGTSLIPVIELTLTELAVSGELIVIIILVNYVKNEYENYLINSFCQIVAALRT